MTTSDLDLLLERPDYFLYSDAQTKDDVLSYAQTMIEHFRYRIAGYRQQHMLDEAAILEAKLIRITEIVHHWQETEG